MFLFIFSQVPDGQSGERLVLRLSTDACDGQDNMVNYLEHTQAIITLNSTRRGDVTIYLTSPMGTSSILLSERPGDSDVIDGFQRWPFMTSHTWGEDPRGEWVLEVAMVDGSPHTATLSEWTLVLHGTKEGTYIEEAKSRTSCKKAVSESIKEQEEEEKEQEKIDDSQPEPMDLAKEIEVLKNLGGAIDEDTEDKVNDLKEETDDSGSALPHSQSADVPAPQDIPDSSYYQDAYSTSWHGENDLYGSQVGRDPWNGWTEDNTNDGGIDWEDPDFMDKLEELFERKYGRQKYPSPY